MSDYKTYEVRVYADGTKKWFLSGKLHREDGPAVEYANGSKHWYLHGEELTEEEHRLLSTQTEANIGISTVKNSPKKNTGSAQAGSLATERSLRSTASNAN